MRTKSNTMDFIKKAKNIHGDKYDYSCVEYFRSNQKIEIICFLHGKFKQTPNSHLMGHGCPKCKNIAISKRLKYSVDVFIKKAKMIHGNKYDYSLINLDNCDKKVEIICPLHGVFKQRPNNHLKGVGCRQCANIYLKDVQLESLENYIIKAKKRHGDFFDYSQSIYSGYKNNIKIICPIHGSFYQKAGDHLTAAKQKCPKCSGRNKTKNDFIEQAKKIHGNKYNYDSVNYKGSNTKVEILCIKHNHFFYMTPHNHIGTHAQGCPICRYEIMSEKSRFNNDIFIKKSKEVHGDLFIYDKVSYVNNSTKVEIICKKHGSFFQTPSSHFSGQGCPVCNSSKGEIRIRDFLKKNNIDFEEQKKFVNCKYKRILPLDFYLPFYNLIIEFHGLQHYECRNNYFHKTCSFETQQIKDEIKRCFAKDNNIKLLEIPYWNKNHIESILIKELNLGN